LTVFALHPRACTLSLSPVWLGDRHGGERVGYAHPVVALTANAGGGQADIFLANGFNDFISKPIDMRQMNAVLKKFVRDKQPQEVIEAARRKRSSR